MQGSATQNGEVRLALVAAIVFSALSNVLLLTSPLYMLQVYDRVLTSGSVETLTALFATASFVFVLTGVLDIARGRIFMRIAALLEPRIDSPAVAGPPIDSVLALDRAGLSSAEVEGSRALASPGFSAALDLPFVPVFLAVLWLLDPSIGIAAGTGATIMLCAGTVHAARLRRLAAQAQRAQQGADHLKGQILLASRYSDGPDATRACEGRLNVLRQETRRAMRAMAEGSADFSAVSRCIRQVMQAGIVAVAALAVLDGSMSVGAMAAASILGSRALGPVDQAGSFLGGVRAARAAWRRPPGNRPPATATPHLAPIRALRVKEVALADAGRRRFVLRNVSFEISAGAVLGVTGPSGSGKSLLLRAVAGLALPASGMILFDGEPFASRWPDLRGRPGFLPQRWCPAPGSVAATIAGDGAIGAAIAAAELAGAHDAISGLADGYATRLDPFDPGGLSDGELRRIGLARAVFGTSGIVLLDEPDSGLDQAGLRALGLCLDRLRNDGRIAIVATNRPSILNHCDRIMVLDAGTVRAIGPRDAILQRGRDTSSPAQFPAEAHRTAAPFDRTSFQFRSVRTPGPAAPDRRRLS